MTENIKQIKRDKHRQTNKETEKNIEYHRLEEL